MYLTLKPNLPSSYAETSYTASTPSYEPNAYTDPESYSPLSYNSDSLPKGPSYSEPAYRIAVTVSDKTSNTGFQKDNGNFPKFDDFFQDMIHG